MAEFLGKFAFLNFKAASRFNSKSSLREAGFTFIILLTRYSIMKQETAKNILKENEKTWDEIAQTFEKTRHYHWDLEPLIGKAKKNSKILDLGCGNGRLFEILKEKGVSYIGIDNSKQLINLAKKKYPKAQFFVGSALNLPFKDNSFDSIYSMAVLHLIPSKQSRLLFLKEAKRVLKKNGRITLTVWYLWSKKYFKFILTSSLLKLLGKSKLGWKDAYIPWQKKYKRYHHAFTKKELVSLFKKAGFKIEKCEYLKRNKRKVNLFINARKP